MSTNESDGNGPKQPPAASEAAPASPTRQGDFSTLSPEQQRRAVDSVKRIARMEEAIKRGVTDLKELDRIYSEPLPTTPTNVVPLKKR